MPWTFITHPEVTIEPMARVEDWGLSAAGRARAAHAVEVVPRPAHVVSSAERKARETATVLAAALGVEVVVDRELGEMDRSATGYLPPDEFDVTVDAFFAEPTSSIRGWERAVDAQRRIERAVRRQLTNTRDSVAFVSHGGMGGLLLASLTGAPISRGLDQPGLGSWFTFDPGTWRALSGWQRLD
ncbi:histidine phosphatase family protein [Curtobacterium sp. MCBD17_013]|uniref:histidine phosphatase family protein n=1 Tax=Curtobacterium sp. MCBD17_013 TaxID=2175668 RepID=UPI000DAA6043|nr:histidine phosphatase family protein [Curtobacterium sp. MCBD17_013]PZF65375.1 histidine phosphatase family protein [Curtobacterium sp. MCBD17_013]